MLVLLTEVLLGHNTHGVFCHNVGLEMGDEGHDVHKWEQVWNDKLE